MRNPLSAFACAMLVFSALAGAACAEDLRIAMKGVVDNADPHQSYTPNRNVQIHVYEPLVFQDAQLRPMPGLAQSWRAASIH